MRDIIARECINLHEEINFRYEKGDAWKWIEENRVILGEPWSWEHAKIAVELADEDEKHLDFYVENGLTYLRTAPRPYFRQYLSDETRIKVAMKCRQSEFSETEINYALYKCISRDYYNVRHLFPTAGIANQIAKEKITVAIDESPRIRRMLDRPYNLTEKKFLTTSFYTVDGAYNEHGGRGPSAEHIIFDEYNTHNPKIKDVYSESTSHARYGGVKIYISTPTLPNMGIHEEFMAGTQYQWYCTCPNCKREQTLLFPDNLINFVERGRYANSDEEDRALRKVYIGCRYCKAYIDKTSEQYAASARWIAKFPLRKEIASYLITGLMLAWKTGREINRKYLKMRFVHQFYNEVVGIQYAGDSVRVTKEQVIACQDKKRRNIMRRTHDMKNVSVGIDWGETESWVCVLASTELDDTDKLRMVFAMRIANDTLKKHDLPMTAASHVDLAMKIIDVFDADIIVNDANGIGIRDNAKLRDKYGERCWGAFYDVNASKAEHVSKSSVSVNWQDHKGVVTLPRTVELMETMEIFRNSQIFIPLIETNTMQYFVEHVHSLASTYYMDEKNGNVYHVVQHIGPDHLAHAFTYARIGYEKIKIHNPRVKATKKIGMSRTGYY